MVWTLDARRFAVPGHGTVSGVPDFVDDPRLTRILNDVLARAARHLDPDRVWLFGSQARGTATRTSDVDLAFDVPGVARHRWNDFVIEVSDEVPALIDLDLIDLAVCETSLAHEIKTTGRLIYERGSRP